MAVPSTTPTTPRAARIGMWMKCSRSIFAPMKMRTIDNPSFRYTNLSTIFASRKYKALRPSTAQMFEV